MVWLRFIWINLTFWLWHLWLGDFDEQYPTRIWPPSAPAVAPFHTSSRVSISPSVSPLVFCSVLFHYQYLCHERTVAFLVSILGSSSPLLVNFTTFVYCCVFEFWFSEWFGNWWWMFGAIKNGAIDYWLRTVSLEICFCDIYKINKDSLPEYVIRWSGSEWEVIVYQNM